MPTTKQATHSPKAGNRGAIRQGLGKIQAFVRRLEPWGILVALAAFAVDYGARIETRSLNAWQVLANPTALTVPKIRALEYLNSLDGFFCGEQSCLITLKPREPLDGINVSSDSLDLMAKLGTINLSHASLVSARFRNLTLISANLSGANMFAADFNDANLNGADLSDAEISFGILRGASFLDANLARANLVGTDLEGADLAGANLEGADLAGADLEGADLKGVKGWASVKGKDKIGNLDKAMNVPTE